MEVVARLEVPTLPRGGEWTAALHDLAGQLDAGRIYDRDLAALSAALDEVLAAQTRRFNLRGGHR